MIDIWIKYKCSKVYNFDYNNFNLLEKKKQVWITKCILVHDYITWLWLTKNISYPQTLFENLKLIGYKFWK